MKPREDSLAALISGAQSSSPELNTPTLLSRPDPVATTPESTIPEGAEVVAAFRVDPHRVAVNPYNPAERYEDLSDLESLKTGRQIQAVNVVSREAFLQLFPPEHPDHRRMRRHVGACDWVAISGSRRTYAHQEWDLPRLTIMLDNALVEALKAAAEADPDDTTGATLSEAHAGYITDMLLENLGRKNPDPLAVAEQCLEIVEATKHARSQAATARHLGKTPGWISQQLSVARDLVPELKALLRDHENSGLRFADARKLAGFPADEQIPTWHAWERDRTQKIMGEDGDDSHDSHQAESASNTSERATTVAKARKSLAHPKIFRLAKTVSPRDLADAALERFTTAELRELADHFAQLAQAAEATDAATDGDTATEG